MGAARGLRRLFELGHGVAVLAVLAHVAHQSFAEDARLGLGRRRRRGFRFRNSLSDWSGWRPARRARVSLVVSVDWVHGGLRASGVWSLIVHPALPPSAQPARAPLAIIQR